MNSVKPIEFEARLETFVKGCRDIYETYMRREFPTNPVEAFRMDRGPKYVRVVRGGAVHCFVDRTNGNVLKAAGWKAPAKHARGNIFDAANGLAAMGPYGAAYLR